MKEVRITIRTPQTKKRSLERKAEIADETGDHSDSDFSVKELKFIEGICAGKTQAKAYVGAGYEEHAGNASRLRRYEHISAEIGRRMKDIESAVFEMLLGKSTRAVEILSDDLLENGTQFDSVRLRAASEILDRGGFTTKRRLEIVADVTQKVSVVDLIMGISIDDVVEEDEYGPKEPEEEDSEDVDDDTDGPS